MLIQNGVVHTMDGPIIPSGYVLTEGTTIRAVGPTADLPACGGEVFDAAGGHIFPGMVDAHCHLGVIGDSLGFEGDDVNEVTDPCTPNLRAIDAVNPMDRCFKEAREAGITTVLTGPGSANPIAGQFAALKTDGRWVDDMVVRAPAAMKFALGENPKGSYSERKETPITRMATTAIIRENLARAVEYRDKCQRAGEDEDEEMPDFDARLEALQDVVAGKLPVQIHAHRADDIATAVRISQEFGLDYVIVHGTEGYLVADELARAGARVITGPSFGSRCKPELTNKNLSNPAILAKAGVKVAICTDHDVIPIQHLPMCAALAVKGGMEPEEALAAITSTAAELGGVSRRVGTLTPGKDADVVVTDGAPLDWASKVKLVLVSGRRVV